MPGGLENGQSAQIVAGSRIKLGKEMDAPVYAVVRTGENPPQMSLRLLSRTEGYPETLAFDGKPLVIARTAQDGGPSYRAVIDFNAEKKIFTITPQAEKPQTMYLFTPGREDLDPMWSAGEKLRTDVIKYEAEIKEVNRLTLDNGVRGYNAARNKEEIQRFFPGLEGVAGYDARDGGLGSSAARGQSVILSIFEEAQTGFLTAEQKGKIAQAQQALETIRLSGNKLEPGYINPGNDGLDAGTRVRNATDYVVDELARTNEVYFSEMTLDHHMVGMIEKSGNDYFYTSYNGGDGAKQAANGDLYVMQRYKLDKVKSDADLRLFLHDRLDRVAYPRNVIVDGKPLINPATNLPTVHPKFTEASDRADSWLGKPIESRAARGQIRGNCTYNSNELAVADIIHDPELSDSVRRFGMNAYEEKLGDMDPQLRKTPGLWRTDADLNPLPDPNYDGLFDENLNLARKAGVQQRMWSNDAYKSLQNSVESGIRSLDNPDTETGVRNFLPGEEPVRFGSNPSSVFYTPEADASALRRSFDTAAGDADNVLFGRGLYREPRFFERMGTNVSANPESRLNGLMKSTDNVVFGPKPVMPMVEGAPLFRDGLTLEEKIASSRIETPLTRTSSVFRIAAGGISESKLINNPVVETASTVLNSNVVKQGGKVLGIVGSGLAVFDVTGLRERTMGRNTEEKVLGDGLLKRGQSSGMGGLSQFNSLAGAVPVVGQVTTAVTATAYHVFGLRSDNQLFLETVNAYNTRQESDPDRQKRWDAFARSIPSDEIIRMTSLNNPDEVRANLAKNMTDFMKRFPDARLGDVALVMQDSNKDILKELCYEKPNWEYIKHFVDNAQVADVRQAYAAYAAENSKGWFTAAPLVGDQFKVPEAGNLFHLNGDHPYGIPGVPSLNRDALIEAYADRFHAALDSQRSLGLLQTDPTAEQLLVMTEQERADYKRQREDTHRSQVADETAKVREQATAEVDKTVGYLEDSHNSMMTSLNQTAGKCAAIVDQAGIDTRDRLKKNQIDIDRADREIRKAADGQARQYWENMKQLSVNDNETMKKWYQDVVKQQTEFLQDFIQKRVDKYTTDRDAYLFGGSFADGESTVGLQGALNSYRFDNGVKAPLVDVRPFVNEAAFMNADPNQMMVQVIENGTQNRSAPAARKPGT